MEEVNVSEIAAEHIHALHLAREAFIHCESDKILRDALKQRVYPRGDKFTKRVGFITKIDLEDGKAQLN